MVTLEYPDPTPDPTKETPLLSDYKYNSYINIYKKTLKTYWKLDQQKIYVEWADVYINLNCYVLPDEKSMYKFRWSKTSKKYQYDLRGVASLDNKRPRAWRVPFLNDPNYQGPVEKYTVSHLCHNNRCYNWNHHILERLPVNIGRNGCSGLGCCHHKNRCIRPGPEHNQ